MSNVTDSPNPNVQLLYDIIDDFVYQNELNPIELMGLFEVIKIQYVLNCREEEDGDQTDSPEN